MERKLEEFEVTETERRFGITPQRAAPILGVSSSDSARRLLRDAAVKKHSRGAYDVEAVFALRVRRIEQGLIHPEAGLPVAVAS